MGIARTLLYAAHSTGSYTTLLGSPTFTLDGGETLICAWNGFSVAEEAAPTISGGGTFTKITQAYNNFVDSGKSYGGFFKLENAAAGSRTVTPPVIDGGQDGMLVVYKVTGVPATMILRAYAKNQQLTSSNTFTLTVGGGTPQVGDLAFGFRFHENSAGSTDVITWPSGWTSDFQYLNGSVNLPTDASTLIITSAGSLTAQWDDIDPAITDTTGAIIVIGPTPVPTIDTQPTGKTAHVGSTATLNIAATTSGGPLHYQWKDDGTNVGTDANSYTTGTLSGADNQAQITCVVSDDNGSITSVAAILNVIVLAPGGNFDDEIDGDWFGEDVAPGGWFDAEFVDVATVGTGTGTSSVTLAGVTTAATGVLALAAASNATLANVVTAGPSKLFIVAASSAQLADVQTAATGALKIQAASNATLADIATSATGVLSTAISGASAVMFDNVTSGATASLPIAGTGAGQMAGIVTSSTGALAIKAASAVTLDAMTTAATGVGATNTGASSVTLEAVSTTATGVLAIHAASAVTFDNVTSGATASLPIAGTGAGQMAGITTSSTGVLAIKAASAVTLDAMTTSATGVSTAVNTGTSNVTLADMTSAATATLKIQATSSVTLADVVTAGPSKLYLVASSSAQLDGMQSSATGTLRLVASGGVTLGNMITSAVGGVEGSPFGPPSQPRTPSAASTERTRSTHTESTRRTGTESTRR